MACRAYSPASPPSTPAPSGGTGAIESANEQLQALTTSNGIIYGVDGGELAIAGVVWYGFDNGTSLFGLEVSPYKASHGHKHEMLAAAMTRMCVRRASIDPDVARLCLNKVIQEDFALYLELSTSGKMKPED